MRGHRWSWSTSLLVTDHGLGLAAVGLIQVPRDLAAQGARRIPLWRDIGCGVSTLRAVSSSTLSTSEVAQRAGNSIDVLLTRYAKCLYDRQSITNQRIEHLLRAYDPPSPDDETAAGPLEQ